MYTHKKKLSKQHDKTIFTQNLKADFKFILKVTKDMIGYKEHELATDFILHHLFFIH